MLKTYMQCIIAWKHTQPLISQSKYDINVLNQ